MFVFKQLSTQPTHLALACVSLDMVTSTRFVFKGLSTLQTLGALPSVFLDMLAGTDLHLNIFLHLQHKSPITCVFGHDDLTGFFLNIIPHSLH